MSLHKLSMPASGTLPVAVAPGDVYELSFDTSAASFQRSGTDLTITFDGGGRIVMTGFFAENEGGKLPGIKLADGTELDGGDFLRGLDPSFDINTAAGPGNASPNSGGAGEYTDAAGDLIDGVDRLGSLGTDHWDRNTEAPETFAALEAVAALGGPAGPANPSNPNPPQPWSGTYQARAVLYAHGADSQSLADPDNPHQVTARSLENDGNGGANWSVTTSLPSVDYAGGNDAQYITVTVNPDGTFSFALTAAGLAFLQNSGKEFLDFYYTVKVPGSDSYVIQVVVPIDPEFDSKDMDDKTVAGGDVSGELDAGGLIHGEWHQGTKNDTTGYDVVSSNLSDEMNYTGVIRDSSIKTGYAQGGAWGADTVTVNGMIEADGNSGFNVIEALGADSHVTINADSAANAPTSMRATNGGANRITATGENSVVDILATGGGGKTVRGMQAISSSQNPASSNTIEAEKGEVHIRATTGTGGSGGALGMSANKGSNSITNAEGTVDVTAEGGQYASAMHAQNGGSNSIGSSAKLTGDVTLTAKDSDLYNYTMYANSDSENAVYGETVTINAEGTGAAGMYTANGSNSATGGRNEVHFTDEAILSVKGNGGHDASGISGNDKSLNSIKDLDGGAGRVSIDVSGAKNVHGTDARNGEIVIESNDLDVTVRADGSTGSNAYGIQTTASSSAAKTTFTGSDADISVKGAENAFGISAWAGGVNEITTDTLSLDVAGSKRAVGLEATGGKGAMAENAKNVVNSDEISIAAAGAEASGIYAGSGTNMVHGKNGLGDFVEKLSVKAESTTGDAAAVHAQGSGSGNTLFTNIQDGSGPAPIHAASSSGNAYGLRAAGGSNEIIAAAGSAVRVKAEVGENAMGKQAHAMSATSNGTNTVNADVVRLEASAAGAADAAGAHASLGGNNVVTTNAVEITATSAKGNASGLQADGAYSANMVMGNAVEITATASNGNAYGMKADGANSANSVLGKNTGALNVTVTAQGKDADSSYAMHATGGGKNAITSSGGHADTVEVNGSMYANASQNVIATGDTVGINAGGSDTVTVNGGMTAEADGMNQIHTGNGAGDDSIGVSGDVLATGSGAGNRFNTGRGQDTVAIGGSVTAEDSGQNTFALSGGGELKTVDVAGGITATNKGENLFHNAEPGNPGLNLDLTVGGEGMVAENEGRNAITGSMKADDSVKITGNVISRNDGSTDINMNGGKDTVEIDGALVASDGLVLVSSYATSSDDSLTLTVSDGILAEGDRGWINIGTVHSYAPSDNGNDSITINADITSQNKGRVEIQTGEGNDAITINGSLTSKDQGLTLVDSGNGFTGDGDDTITVTGDLNAETKGVNELSSGDGYDSISLNDLNATTGGENKVYSGQGGSTVTAGDLNATEAGKNYITSSNGDTTVTAGLMTASGTGSLNQISSGLLSADPHGDDAITVSGMAALDKGRNVITTSDGADTVTVNNGMAAASGGVNEINTGQSVGDKVSVTATTSGKDAVAMLADGTGSANSVTSTTVSVEATASGYPNSAVAMNASNGGKNSVAAKGDVDITAYSKDSFAWGMKAEGAGSANSVTSTDGDVHLKVRTDWDQAYGMTAVDNGKNIISAKGEVLIEIKDTDYHANGLVAEDGGSNTVAKSGSIKIDIESPENATGLGAFGGSNSLASDGSVDILTKAQHQANGMIAQNGGSNTVDKSGSITVDTGSSDESAKGLWAIGGNNSLASDGSVDILTKAEKNAYGLLAQDGGSNAVTQSGSVRIDIESPALATGLWAESGGENIVASNGKVEILAKSQDDYGIGIVSRGGDNTVMSLGALGSVAVDASSANGNANGTETDQGGKTSIYAKGDVTVMAAANGTASAVYGRGGETDIYTDGTVTLSGKSDSGEATGIKLDGYESNGNAWVPAASSASVTASKIAISAEGATDAYGVWAKGSDIDRYNTGTTEADRDTLPKATVTLMAKDITIDASTTGSGYQAAGIYAHNDGGVVKICGDAKQASTLTVTAEGDTAYGILAYGPAHLGGKVTYTGGDGNDTVTLTATGKEAATGVYAKTGKTVLDGGAGEDTLVIKASADGFASGLDAGGVTRLPEQDNASSYTYSNNEIRNFEHVTILATAKTGDAIGIQATGNYLYNPVQGDKEYNKIFLGNAARGSLKISAESESGQAAGMFATGNYDTRDGHNYGYNEIHAGNKGADMVVSAAGTAAGSTAYGMYAKWGGYNKIMGSDVNDSISVKADAVGDAYAMFAVRGDSHGQGYDVDRHNTIDGGEGLDTITIAATSTGQDKQAYAMYANESPGNLVTAAGNISVKASASGDAYGMYAGQYSDNTIAAKTGYGNNTITVNATSEAGDAYGMYATKKGANTIEGGDAANNTIKVTATAKGEDGDAYAMYADNGKNDGEAGTGNLIDGKDYGYVALQATAVKGEAVAMRATADSVNTVKIGAGYTSTIHATTEAGGEAYAMKADGPGALNQIIGTSDQGMTLNMSGRVGNDYTYSLYAENGGHNLIQGNSGVKGRDAFDLMGSVYAGAGDGANRSVNEIKTGDGLHDSVLIAGSVIAEDGGKNSINTGQDEHSPGACDSVTLGYGGSLQASGSGNAKGVFSENEVVSHDIKIGEQYLTPVQAGITASVTGGAGGARNTVDAAGTLTVWATGGNDTAYGALAQNTSNEASSLAENVINGHDATIRASGNGSSYGLYAEASKAGSAANRVDIDGTLDIKVQAGSGASSMGIMASGENASNTVKAGNVDIEAGANYVGGTPYGQANGIWADNKGTNTLTADTLTIRAWSPDKMASGISARSGGTNTVNADTTIDAMSAKNNAYGLEAYGGNNVLNGGLNLTVDAFGNANATAYGLSATFGGNNMVATGGKDANIKVGSITPGADAYGLYASSDIMGDRQTNTIDAGGGDIDVSVRYAGNTANTYLDKATGMYTFGDSANTLKNAGSVNIDVEAYGETNGMYAESGLSAVPYESLNLISGADSVTINAESAKGDVYGMRAVSPVTYKAAGVGSAINEIRADEHSPITVTITAKSGNAAAKSYAMYAEGIAAENRITGGSENDLVVVNGNIDVAKGGKNSIHTGAGDDHIRLNGAVGSGALDVQGGDGYDVLVLMASSVSEFNARYKAWLTGLTPEQMAGFGIESIRVSGGMDNDDDISWLHDWINDYNAAYGSNGTISQGEDIGFAWDQALTGDDLMAYDNVPADDTGYHIDVTGDHLAQHADQFGGLTLGGGDDWLLVDGDLTTTVDTGAGHDNLHVSGDLASLVDMGAGNDYLRVEGNLAGGRVYMGDGNDKATIMGDVSGSTIDMGDGDDYLHIFGNVTNSALIGGKGEHDVLHLSLDADGLTNILSDGTVLITGFEDLIMDMTNGSADDLNLDELLGGLSASGVDNVYIRGDQNDSVSLSDNGWTQQGATYTDADGITYDIYQKSGDEMTLYVQQEISAITGG